MFVLCILYIYIRGGSGRLRLVMSSSTLPGIPVINKLCQGWIVIVYDALLELTVYDKTFEGENFRSCVQNTLFTGKLSRCIRPWSSCTVCC